MQQIDLTRNINKIISIFLIHLGTQVHWNVYTFCLLTLDILWPRKTEFSIQFCCGIQICNEVDWKVLDYVMRDSLVLSFQPKRVLMPYEKDYLTQKDLFNRRLSGMREITQSTQVFDNTIKDSFVSPFLTEARVNAVWSKLLNKSLPISLISRFFCFLPGVLTSIISRLWGDYFYARWVKQTDQIVQKKVAWQTSGNCILTMII